MIERARDGDQVRVLLNAAAALRQHASVDAGRWAVTLESIAAAPHHRITANGETMDLLAGLVELAKIPALTALALGTDADKADRAAAASLLIMRNQLLDAAALLIDGAWHSARTSQQEAR